jgi:hypothetical protein
MLFSQEFSPQLHDLDANLLCLLVSFLGMVYSGNVSHGSERDRLFGSEYLTAQFWNLYLNTLYVGIAYLTEVRRREVRHAPDPQRSVPGDPRQSRPPDSSTNHCRTFSRKRTSPAFELSDSSMKMVDITGELASSETSSLGYFTCGSRALTPVPVSTVPTTL